MKQFPAFMIGVMIGATFMAWLSARTTKVAWNDREDARFYMERVYSNPTNYIDSGYGIPAEIHQVVGKPVVLPWKSKQEFCGK